DFIALGLFAGIGWWSLPEIVYFVLPAGLLVVGAIVQSGRSVKWWAGRLGAALLAAIAGAFPWLWANVNSGFASIKPGRFPRTDPAAHPRLCRPSPHDLLEGHPRRARASPAECR